MNRLWLCVLILSLLALGLAACSRDGDSTEPEPTITTDAPETTAAPTAAAEPQPTSSPPQGTPPAVDTSAWLTYTSPYHGFSIKYPQGWTLDAPTTESQAVYVRNPQNVLERAQRAADGIRAHFTPQLAEAWIYVVAGPPGEFDVDGLSTVCPLTIIETVLGDFRAATCGGTGSMWVERPDGAILHIVAENVGRDLGTAQVIETIRGTLTFDEE